MALSEHIEEFSQRLIFCLVLLTCTTLLCFIDVKEIVYEMRFDEVSARYGEFGEFYIGLQLSLDELFQRLAL